ncbi:uncharacterized protein LY79DRAFT_11915 [Colletotrichum navitas]|uniref:Uncharacterized protein n=1 Tax=Colletotrichum navitas TaxID=681940 RepID=A0AAD8QCU8_9PEZI|nr:uncharacterized protein LY79DRAFT_11915 [Colletotrichum navitas]KAK1600241.1 hypothetical protein LY79DRAFT_11915 [Colletotrichum navitas]
MQLVQRSEWALRSPFDPGPSPSTPTKTYKTGGKGPSLTRNILTRDIHRMFLSLNSASNGRSLYQDHRNPFSSPSTKNKKKKGGGKGLVYGGWRASPSRPAAQANHPGQPFKAQPLRSGPLLARHRPYWLQPRAPQQRSRLRRRAPCLPPARHVAGRPRHDRRAMATGPGQRAADGVDCRLQHRVGVRHVRGRGLGALGPGAFLGASRRLRRGRGLAPGPVAAGEDREDG